jgi:hypothetical protein
VKRIRHDPRVLVAQSSFRGKEKGPSGTKGARTSSMTSTCSSSFAENTVGKSDCSSGWTGVSPHPRSRSRSSPLERGDPSWRYLPVLNDIRDRRDTESRGKHRRSSRFSRARSRNGRGGQEHVFGRALRTDGPPRSSSRCPLLEAGLDQTVGERVARYATRPIDGTHLDCRRQRPRVARSSA